MMNFFRKFFNRPQQMLMRKAFFQIHLWAGLIIGLYLIAVGLTGSILVFEALTPGGKPLAIMLPRNEKAPLTVFLTRGEIVADSAEPPSDVDKVYFDPYNGNHLGSESLTPNRTVGDWIIWSMVPLHFGTQWGFTVKILWAVLGLSIPILTVTSFLMYWNRYLSKKWRQLQERARKPAELATEISN
jgi:uncharacterized iron-regulated membrane protein